MRRLLLALACLLPIVCTAQTREEGVRRTRRALAETAIYNNYLDSLAACKKALLLPAGGDTLATGAAPDVRYMRLFTPMTYHPELLHRHFSLDSLDVALTADKSTIDNALINIYIHHPDYVRWYRKPAAAPEAELFGSKHKAEVAPLTETFEVPQAAVEDFASIDLVITKPNFWTLRGTLYLQIMQNYYSANWYQGLESNYSWLTKVTLEANYNNKQKITWDNKLEMNIGFQTDRSDEKHKLKTSDDLLRYTGKFGLQATKKWYYTLQVVANTQFMRSYASNSDDVNSAFFSPFNINASIGMSYNVSWCKGRLTGSAYFSPIAINLKYYKRLNLAADNGIAEGKHSLVDFGSTFTLEGTWKFNNIISWKTRLYGYTPYDRLELQWENTFTIQVSKIIAMTVYVYPRFDDSSAALKDKGYGYFQLKEYTSFGFTFSF